MSCLVLSCLGYSPLRGSPTSLLIFRFDRRFKTFRLRLESSPSIHSYLVESSSLTIHFIPRTKGDPWIWVSSLLKFVELGVRLVLLPLHPPGAFLDIPTWWCMPDAFPGRRLKCLPSYGGSLGCRRRCPLATTWRSSTIG